MYTRRRRSRIQTRYHSSRKQKANERLRSGLEAGAFRERGGIYIPLSRGRFVASILRDIDRSRPLS
jgi:hypothetical protein